MRPKESVVKITSEHPHGQCPKCDNRLNPDTMERFGGTVELKRDDNGEYLEVTCKSCGWIGGRQCFDDPVLPE